MVVLGGGGLFLMASGVGIYGDPSVWWTGLAPAFRVRGTGLGATQTAMINLNPRISRGYQPISTPKKRTIQR
jgi:hypothetical protein